MPETSHLTPPMSETHLPKELRESLRRTGQFVSRAILLSPQRAEGTAVFDQRGGKPGTSGDFFPTRTSLVVSENERCQLHLEKSNIVLNVRLSPSRSEPRNVEHFRFSLVAWEAVEEIPLEPCRRNPAWKPAIPPCPPRRCEGFSEAVKSVAGPSCVPEG